MSGTTHLYRHFDAQDRLLYIGISKTALRRLAQHYSTAHWANSVARVEIETFGTKAEAVAAENLAIKTEAPLHNILAAPRPDTAADTEPITLRLPHEVLEALDAMRQAAEFPPNRQETIRVLLTQKLKERGYLK